jgi:hypothetical protein
MDEHREGDQEDVKLPEEPVEDLEADEEESADVKGGTFKQGFPVKWQGAP